MLLLVQSFAWWAAAFSQECSISTLHTPQLSKLCISDLEGSLGRESLIKSGKSVYEKSLTWTYLPFCSCGFLIQQDEECRAVGKPALMPTCTPPVLRYPRVEMASVVLPPLHSGVSSFSRWSRSTKQYLGVDCWHPFFVGLIRVVYISPGCFKPCFGGFGWEGLENWLPPKAFPLQILLPQVSALTLLLMTWIRSTVVA